MLFELLSPFGDQALGDPQIPRRRANITPFLSPANSIAPELVRTSLTFFHQSTELKIILNSVSINSGKDHRTGEMPSHLYRFLR